MLHGDSRRLLTKAFGAMCDFSSLFGPEIMQGRAQPTQQQLKLGSVTMETEILNAACRLHRRLERDERGGTKAARTARSGSPGDSIQDSVSFACLF
jgi:hypothetical protein